MIAVIDYNSGNVASLGAALERLGELYCITNNPVVILAADKVIFPGQGRTGPAMKELKRLGLDVVIKDLTVPFLGICLGMQLLLEYSEEDKTKCLGIIPGEVKRFSGKTTAGNNLPVPHMGWNTMDFGGGKRDYFYYVHSYYVPVSEYTIGRTLYGEEISGMIQKDNYYGLQFHPEKSGYAGMKILQQFCAGTLNGVNQKTFQLWPAIDLIDGQCVRLTQGDYEQVVKYDQNPVQLAQQFEFQGAYGIHIVDLAAAQAGAPMNIAIIQSIVEAVSIPVQVGGGIRSVEIAEKYLNSGVQRVIIGTAAINNPEMVEQLIQKYSTERVVISLDVKDNQIAIKGWQEQSELSLEEAVEQLQKVGAKEYIVTDISSDGRLQGSNAKLLETFQNEKYARCNVLLAGGVSSSVDIQVAKAAGACGVIIGKALYEGKLKLEDCFNGGRSVGLTKRIIPCMDIADGRVMKGTNFTQLQDAGDPVELAEMYSKSGADELVFLDINATIENRNTLYNLVKKVAGKVTIPFTVGGGIRTINDIRVLLRSGADKVSIGSAAVSDPEFVRAAANEFGAQCIVISVDPKWNGCNWEIYIKGGREATGLDAIAFGKQMEELGAGELLVNSLDRDGTKQGYDLELLKAITNSVSIPIIASSGVGTVQHFAEAFTETKISAALAASVFHYQELSVGKVKKYLNENNVSVRL